MRTRKRSSRKKILEEVKIREKMVKQKYKKAKEEECNRRKTRLRGEGVRKRSR